MRDGRAVKHEFDIALPAGMTALVFNTRRAVFKDARVREALIYLFDFEWINRTLYAGLYRRTQSYFERSILASAGRPADAHERDILAPFPDAVKPAFMAGTYRFPSTDGSGRGRENQEKAFRLLQEAGYELRGGRLVDAKSGRQIEFEILASSTSQEGLLLSFARDVERLGIKVKLRVVDGAQYQQRLTSYDYDMIQNTWSSSLSPGNEQLFRWSTQAAKTDGTYNFAGVENPAADAMIQAMLAAKTEDDFVSAVRALDRVLLSGDYVIPLFFIPKQWVAYWTRLRHPETDAAVRLQRRQLVVGGREMTDAADTLPQRFNMAAYAIGRAATARPKHPALIVMDAPGAPPAEVWTFADVEDAVLRIAGGLKAAGIRRALASSSGWRTPAPTRSLFSAPSPAGSCRCRPRRS